MIAGAEIIEVWQGSDEWLQARLGIPTASNAAKITAGGDGKTRSEYMRKLAGEEVSRLPREEYRGKAMERGNGMEPELRALYQMMTGRIPLPVSLDSDLKYAPGSPGYGFVRRPLKIGAIGASPDSSVGKDGGLEIKSAAPHVLIEIMQRGSVPAEHIPQCQCTMLVTGWAWIDLLIGYTGMPPFIRRVRRDPSKIAQLEVGIQSFNEELIEMVSWVRQYGKETGR